VGYSAPPLRFKQNGWLGNLACGLVRTSRWLDHRRRRGARRGAPDWRILTLALLYGLGAHGIMTLNDFKSVSGDRRMGVRSLPVLLGERRAALTACAVMLAPAARRARRCSAPGAPGCRSASSSPSSACSSC
jgi:chlorophyll synthase